jgi:hypothetical protein
MLVCSGCAAPRRWQAGNSSTFPRLAMGGDSSGGQLTLETLAALASPRHAAPGSIKLMAAAWAFAPQVPSTSATHNQQPTACLTCASLHNAVAAAAALCLLLR